MALTMKYATAHTATRTTAMTTNKERRILTSLLCGSCDFGASSVGALPPADRTVIDAGGMTGVLVLMSFRSSPSGSVFESVSACAKSMHCRDRSLGSFANALASTVSRGQALYDSRRVLGVAH